MCFAVLPLIFAALGCGSSSESPTPTGTPDSTGGGADTVTAQDPGATPNDPGPAPSDPGGASDPGGGADGAEDPGLPELPSSTVDKCGTKTEGGLPVGSECTDHAECATGYCYDEALWNEDHQGGFRFCTAACTACTVVGNCNEWPKADGTLENKCNPFPGYYIKYHQLTATSACLATCKSDADCVNVAPLTKCALLRLGKDDSYGINKVCQPPDFARLPKDAYK